MRASMRSLATGSQARELSLMTSFAIVVGIGLSMLAPSAPASAQDAAKVDSTSAPPAASEGTAESGRHHGRKHDDAKSGTAKADQGAKPDTAATGDSASKIDSNAVAVVKQPEQECRTVRPTGSRMSKRICATPEQWKEVDARGQAGAKEMKRTIESSSSVERPTPPSMPGGAFP